MDFASHGLMQERCRARRLHLTHLACSIVAAQKSRTSLVRVFPINNGNRLFDALSRSTLSR